MMLARPDPRAWTPECAVCDGRLTARVSEIAEAWVQDWLVSGPRLSLTTDLGLGSRRSKDTDLCWQAEGLVLVVSRRGLSAMGAAMANYPRPTSRDEDDTFLHAVAEHGVAELWSSLTTLFASRPTQPRQAGLSLDKAARMMCRFDDCAFELFIAEDRLAAARTALAKPMKTLAPPSRRSEALAHQSLDLSVLIGEARLGLHAMKTLAVGDVIVLERNTRDDLELLVAGQRAPDLGCRLDRDGDRIALSITQPSAPTD